MADVASAIGVRPHWLQQVLAGELTESPADRRRALQGPRNVWPPDVAARAFVGWQVNTFDVDGE